MELKGENPYRTLIPHTKKLTPKKPVLMNTTCITALITICLSFFLTSCGPDRWTNTEATQHGPTGSTVFTSTNSGAILIELPEIHSWPPVVPSGKADNEQYEPHPAFALKRPADGWPLSNRLLYTAPQEAVHELFEKFIWISNHPEEYKDMKCIAKDNQVVGTLPTRPGDEFWISISRDKDIFNIRYYQKYLDRWTYTHPDPNENIGEEMINVVAGKQGFISGIWQPTGLPIKPFASLQTEAGVMSHLHAWIERFEIFWTWNEERLK